MIKWTSRGIATFAEGVHSDPATPGLRPVVRIGKGGELNRRWVFRYRYDGQRRDAGLGRLDKVGIKAARQETGRLRELLDAGADPLAPVQKASANQTFASIAASYVRLNRRAGSRQHGREWVRSLKTHASALRSVPVDKVTLRMVAETLAPAWRSQYVTAKRVAGRIDKVLWHAVGLGMLETHPAPLSALTALMPKQPRGTAVQHMAAVAVEGMPGLYARLVTEDDVVSRALRWTILTTARTGEARLATWDEIEEGLWILQPRRTKPRRQHIVPLSS